MRIPTAHSISAPCSIFLMPSAPVMALPLFTGVVMAATLTSLHSLWRAVRILKLKTPSTTPPPPHTHSCLQSHITLFQLHFNFFNPFFRSNWTPLHYCCAGYVQNAGRIDICKFLLRCKADIEATSLNLYNTPSYSSIPIAHASPHPF